MLVGTCREDDRCRDKDSDRGDDNGPVRFADADLLERPWSPLGSVLSSAPIDGSPDPGSVFHLLDLAALGFDYPIR